MTHPITIIAAVFFCCLALAVFGCNHGSLALSILGGLGVAVSGTVLVAFSVFRAVARI